MTLQSAARIARGYEEATAGERLVGAAREMRGMFAQMTPEQREAALAYDGPDCANDNREPTLDDLIGKAVYLASPYTKYAHGHAAAAYDAAEVAARLIDYGLSPLSPIAHSHAVATVGRLDKVDGELWQRVDAPWVRVAEACVVVKMPGWEESAGVQHEIAEFRAAGKPVVFMAWGMG